MKKIQGVIRCLITPYKRILDFVWLKNTRGYKMLNYTLCKNPGFWLVNSRCIVRVFSYLGLISFIFPLPGYLHDDLTFCSLCAVVFAKTYFTVLPSRASNRQIHSEYFFITFIRKVTWLIKFESWKYSDVNVFHFFTLACIKPSNSFEIPIKN
jgi:hypothetical protein